MNDLWRKTLVYLGLVEEPEEHDEHEMARQERAEARQAPRPEERPDASKVRPIRAGEDNQTHVRPVTNGPVPVTIVRPVDFEDAERVGERYRAGQPVLLDLGEVETPIARRLLDFVSGTIFALRGRISPAGTRSFLLLPEGVEVGPDDRRRLADLGYHLQSPASAGDDRA